MASIKSKRKPKKEPKRYTIYHFEYWDDSIEEYNSAYQVLTEKIKNELELIDEECFYSGTHEMTLNDILRSHWSVDDIDQFVSENPECSDNEFRTNESVWSDELGWFVNARYTPLFAIRDKKIDDILS
jgi:hypothetical protein